MEKDRQTFNQGKSQHMLIRRITANGNTWVLNLPKKYMRPLGYHLGQYVHITILEDSTMIMRPLKEELYEVRKIR